MSCTEIRLYLEAFVDDELSPERTLQVHAHLRGCTSCRDEVELSRAIARTTRTSCLDVLPCPDFSTRLRDALDEECRRQERHEHAHHNVRPLGWKVIVPLSAAAAAVLSLGYIASNPASDDKASSGVQSATNQPRLGFAPESLVDALLQHHTRPSEPEVTDSRSVDYLETELGFPVRAPNLDRYGARFLGANLIHVDRTHAASLHYVLNGRRVTLYVYNPEELPMRAVRALHPTVVGDRAVFVGQKSGYSIATCERGGVGYAVTADLGDRESAELIAAVGH